MNQVPQTTAPAGGAVNTLQAGFTLLELMIAVAILAILLGVAFPSYQAYVVQGNRAQAQADLLSAAQEAENVYAQRLSYASVDDTPLPFTTTSPKTGDAIYNLSASATATTFTITAAPVSGGKNDGDGNLAIDNTGQRFWDRNADGDYGDTDEESWED